MIVGCSACTGRRLCIRPARLSFWQDFLLESMPVVVAPQAVHQQRVVLRLARILRDGLPLAQLLAAAQVLLVPQHDLALLHACGHAIVAVTNY